MTDLALAAIEIARRYLGKQETSPNRGPLVDEWLAYVGIHPGPGEAGAPWCAAFSSWVIGEAEQQVGVTLDFRKSAGALRLLAVNCDMIVDEPDSEALTLVVWDHGGGKGHVGIVTGVTRVGGVLASLTCISGNTNAAGSRDADSVIERGFPQPDARKIAGFIRVA